MIYEFLIPRIKVKETPISTPVTVNDVSLKVTYNETNTLVSADVGTELLIDGNPKRRVSITPYPAYALLKSYRRCDQTFDKFDIFNISCLEGKTVDLITPDVTYTAVSGETIPEQSVYVDLPCIDVCVSDNIKDVLVFGIQDLKPVGDRVVTYVRNTGVGDVTLSNGIIIKADSFTERDGLYYATEMNVVINGVESKRTLTLADFGVHFRPNSDAEYRYIDTTDVVLDDWITHSNKLCYKQHKIREVDPDDNIFPKLISKCDARDIDDQVIFSVPKDTRKVILYAIDRRMRDKNLYFNRYTDRVWRDCRFHPDRVIRTLIKKINNIDVNVYKVDSGYYCCDAVLLKPPCSGKLKVEVARGTSVVALFLS